MTRTLILMRHAKSAWDQPGLSDHDRKLNMRGRLAASLMGAYLRDRNLAPDFAYVSSAARAQETWAEMDMSGPMETRPELYLAGPAKILAVARAAPDDAERVLILAHQPGMQETANMLLPDWAVDEYPTGKLTVIEFDAPRWDDVAFRGGRLAGEAAPKTLV